MTLVDYHGMGVTPEVAALLEDDQAGPLGTAFIAVRDGVGIRLNPMDVTLMKRDGVTGLPHLWFDPADIGYGAPGMECCRLCGVVRPRDPLLADALRCRGHVRVGLR